jgi:hypothetical protein
MVNYDVATVPGPWYLDGPNIEPGYSLHATNAPLHTTKLGQDMPTILEAYDAKCVPQDICRDRAEYA